MPTSRVVRRIAAPVVAVCLASVLGAAAHARPVAGDTADRLRLDFEADAPAGTSLTSGAVIADVSGLGNHGVVVTAFGGSVDLIADAAGIVADFPADCATQPCPNALVQVADDASLDPAIADFEWGARILMQANETDDGENVMQKGLTDDPGGQWKLQVDKAGGVPSCVVSGTVPGESVQRRVVLKASITVADGVWHQVSCRRTAASGLQIVVDGVVRGAAAMPIVDLESNAAVTIGANFVTPSTNDQFHGKLDDAFVTIWSALPTGPTGRIQSMTSPASAIRPAVRLFDASSEP